jgi:hypothetical protein
MNIHPNARTTPKIRAEIRASGLSRKQVKEWQKTHPELFVKKVYNQSRPDI